MNKTISMIAIAASIAACSEAGSDNGSTPATVDAVESTADRAVSLEQQPPAISPDVAPGVAFAFRSLFSLPEDRISEVQERHAALCGSLGVARCRVTGLTFNKERDGEVDARTAFSLDPALALRFAKDASDIVSRAEGRLETSNANGEDVGTEIVSGDKAKAGIDVELRQIETQLRIPGIAKDVRSNLIERQVALRAQLRDLAGTRGSNVERLTMTPVVFEYEAGDMVWGLTRSSPLRQGWSAGASSFENVAGFMALLIGAVAPWALLAGGVWWLVRRLRRKAVVGE